MNQLLADSSSPELKLSNMDLIGSIARLADEPTQQNRVEFIERLLGATLLVPLALEIPPTEPGRHVPASKLRRIIAQRMSIGVHQAVPVTLSAKIDAESLVAYRERLKTESKNGLVPSYNDILIYHAALTLRELPDLNACWYRDGIHSHDNIHIATAVHTSDGLLAPVVRDVDRLALYQIADRTRRLVAQARCGQLSQN